ncbi:MAG: hypothetical protein C5B51_19155 [Terriglobia bacterium]|nr:MAG: hypothetical protein C5B51_19155 [Terriglobia bacterium]
MRPYTSLLHFSRSVLLVSADRQDRPRLQRILDPAGYRLINAETCTDALRLAGRYRPPVLVCDTWLPDGGWKEMLHEIAAMPDAPLLIVISTQADDRLWSEVLNLGGYDVLSKPLADEEVLRVIGLACRPSLPPATAYAS